MLKISKTIPFVLFIIERTVVETENGGHVTSFKINANETPTKRSNERYDEILQQMIMNKKEIESLSIRRRY